MIGVKGKNVAKEFEEIGHSGGKVTFRIVTDQQGHRGYQVTISGDRPVPAAWIGVYALAQGIPVESIQLGGIGQPWNPAPFPGCFQYLSPPMAKENSGTIARTAEVIGAAGHGPTFARIVLSRRLVFNFSQKPSSVMSANTALC